MTREGVTDRWAHLYLRAGKASAPLLPQLAQSLPDWFEGTRHSSFLYVASELVKVFGNDASHREQLGTFIPHHSWLV